MSLVCAILLLMSNSEVEPAAASVPATFVIHIDGVASAEGHVLVALYRREADFPKPSLADYTRKVPAQRGTVTVEFAQLEPGDYAVAAFHDADDNGKLTTALFGIPKEAYGFGNDARGTFGPPSFGESRVTFTGTNSTRLRVK